MEFEEEYKDVLQNIEVGIISVYRENSTILDNDAQDAIKALIKVYTAELEKREPPKINLYELAQPIFESVKAMCDMRLGRRSVIDKQGQKIDIASMDVPAISLNEIIECLKRIEKSIRFWNKSNGKRGYLDYADQFIG